LILSRVIARDAVLALKYFRFTEANGMIIGRLGYSGELGYELLVPVSEKEKLSDQLLEAGSPENLRSCSFDAVNSLRIESGYVLFDREIDGRANPRELGLERLISAPKRFSLRKKLVGFEILDSGPEPEFGLQATSECASPVLERQIGLGFTDPVASRPGMFVRVEDGRLARVASLPFYDPDRRLPRSSPIPEAGQDE
jgi:glycine cleavage system aminomethyltransferase T